MAFLLANLEKIALLGLTHRGTECEALVVHSAKPRSGGAVWFGRRNMRRQFVCGPACVGWAPAICRPTTAESPRDVVTWWRRIVRITACARAA